MLTMIRNGRRPKPAPVLPRIAVILPLPELVETVDIFNSKFIPRIFLRPDAFELRSVRAIPMPVIAVAI